MTRLFGSVLALAVLVCACAPPSTEGTRPFGSSRKGDTDAKDDDLTETSPTATPPATTPPVVSGPIDAGGATGTTYIGTLDATPTVRFGGQGKTGNYCFYDVTLRNVEIEITALPSGQVIAARVKDTMDEEQVPPCTFGVAPPSTQNFAFTTTKETADGVQLAFNGLAANYPATSLVVDIVKKGGSYEAAAAWHRTDQGDPLDWTVKTKITLGPR